MNPFSKAIRSQGLPSQPSGFPPCLILGFLALWYRDEKTQRVPLNPFAVLFLGNADKCFGVHIITYM
jgi:hypothetical protein